MYLNDHLRFKDQPLPVLPDSKYIPPPSYNQTTGATATTTQGGGQNEQGASAFQYPPNQYANQYPNQYPNQIGDYPQQGYVNYQQQPGVIIQPVIVGQVVYGRSPTSCIWLEAF